LHSACPRIDPPHCGLGHAQSPPCGGAVDEGDRAEARKKGVIVVWSSRVGNGIVARNGEAKDDQQPFLAKYPANELRGVLPTGRCLFEDRV
jgi:hypothetical protein